MQATPRLTRSVSKALSAMGQTGELTQDLGNLIAILSITSELQSAPAKLAYMLERVTDFRESGAASACQAFVGSSAIPWGLHPPFKSGLEVPSGLDSFILHLETPILSHQKAPSSGEQACLA